MKLLQSRNYSLNDSRCKQVTLGIAITPSGPQIWILIEGANGKIHLNTSTWSALLDKKMEILDFYEKKNTFYMELKSPEHYTTVKSTAFDGVTMLNITQQEIISARSLYLHFGEITMRNLFNMSEMIDGYIVHLNYILRDVSKFVSEFAAKKKLDPLYYKSFPVQQTTPDYLTLALECEKYLGL
jgi:hypothetical protein